jgi:hypothetical protein
MYFLFNNSLYGFIMSNFQLDFWVGKPLDNENIPANFWIILYL